MSMEDANNNWLRGLSSNLEVKGKYTSKQIGVEVNTKK